MQSTKLPFTHLHVHSEYSVRDGLANIPALVEKSKSSGIRALAITDHGYMGGIPELFQFCADSDAVKPIAGCEIYYGDKNYHLVLLAKNKVGYHNLCRIVSSGFYKRCSKPRVSFSALEQYHEGLICCSACIGGEIAQHILHGNIVGAKTALFRLKQVFKDDFYIEIQRSKTDKPNANREVFQLQQQANTVLVQLAKQYGVKVIATNDSHFVDESDAEAHDHLLCMQFGHKWAEEQRLRFSQQEWLKTPNEMARLFEDIPDALNNTQEIADKIEHYNIAHEPMLPVFAVPASYDTPDDYLASLVQNGTQKRYGDTLGKEVTDRIQRELEHIRRRGYASYFLVWWDIVRAARGLSVWMSPGYGDAVGSVICYCLGITDIDPMRFNISYEHFYPSDTYKLPRIEMAFESEGIWRIQEYIRYKYGEACVSRVIRYNRMSADLAKQRLYNCHEGIDDTDAERIAQQLDGAIHSIWAELSTWVISPKPIEELVPTAYAKGGSDTYYKVTQYDRCALEYVGLVCFDMSVQRSLDVLKGAVALVRDKRGVEIDLHSLPLDDSKTLKLLCEGETTGVPRLYSEEMRECLRTLQPASFDDLVRLYAIYRSNPTGCIAVYTKAQSNAEEREKLIYSKFQKSHAVCDMFFAYQCAYMKAHYPNEYTKVYEAYHIEELHPEWGKQWSWNKVYLLKDGNPLKEHWHFMQYLRSIEPHPPVSYAEKTYHFARKHSQKVIFKILLSE